VGELFGSDSSFYVDSSTNASPAATNLRAITYERDFADYSNSLFSVPPLKLVYYGSGGTWSYGGGRISTATYHMDLSGLGFVEGKTYRFMVDEYMSRHFFDKTISETPIPEYHYEVELQLIADNVKRDEKKVATLVQQVPMGASMIKLGPDKLFLEFEMPSGHVVFNMHFRAWVSSSANGNFIPSVTALTNWVGFSQAGFYEVVPFDADGAFRDEQRGFWARLWEFLTGMWDAITAIPEKIGEFFSNLVSAIGDWFAQLGQWFVDLGDKIAQWFQDLMDFFKRLFIPEDGELQAIVEDFKLYAEGKLGFVAQIFALVGLVITQLVNGGSGGDAVLIFPGIKLPDFLGGVQLWQDTELNLTGVVNAAPALTNIYTIYKVLASVLLLGLLLRYLYRVANDILGQRDGGEEE